MRDRGTNQFTCFPTRAADRSEPSIESNDVVPLKEIQTSKITSYSELKSKKLQYARQEKPPSHAGTAQMQRCVLGIDVRNSAEKLGRKPPFPSHCRIVKFFQVPSPFSRLFLAFLVFLPA